MAVFRCKRCKTAIEYEQEGVVCSCGTCGKKQITPKIKDDSAGKSVRDDAVIEKRKKAAAVIISVAAVLCVAFIIVLINVIIPMVRYNNAYNLYDSGKYNEALSLFKEMKDYKDSAELIVKCEAAIRDEKYDAAVKCYDSGDYERALTLFTSLTGYKDSYARITECEAAITEQKYQDAVASIGKDDVVSVYERLTALEGYKDSAEKARELFEQYKTSKLKSAGVGDIVYFGKYEQDNNISNGTEDIEWLVLDKKGTRLFLISLYAIDCQRYNTESADVTWETCSLRGWLNDTFYNTAFSADEQDGILTTTVTADANPTYGTSPGSNTKDKIYLLSIPEVNRYFASDEDRKCAPTEYAIAQGVGVGDSDAIFGRTLCWWALRSPGFYQFYASFVYYFGYVNPYGYDVANPNDAIRPVMWINT